MTDKTYLKIGEATAYLAIQHRISVTRQTVHNWIKKGKNNSKLPAHQDRSGSLTVRREDIDEFVASSVY